LPKTKEGEKITLKEFFKRWGTGIKNRTPKQKVSGELFGTFITLVGFTMSFIALIIFRDKLIVSWFAWGLILIFLGSMVNSFLKCISLYQQLKYFDNMDEIDVGKLFGDEE